MITARAIWQEVLDGRVESALAQSRAHRLRRGAGAGADPDRAATALYLEPSLASSVGHPAALAACYAGLLGELGYRTVVLHAHHSRLPARPDWQPYFLVPHETLAHRPIRSAADLQRVTRYFAGEFGEAVARHGPRLCVFGTIRFTNVMAAAVASARTDAPPRVILGVMETDRVPDCDDPDLAASAFARAAGTLNDAGIAHLLIAETEAVRDFLLSHGFAADAVKVFPYVAASDVATEGVPVGEGVRIGYLGGSRRVRNPELIADLVASRTFADRARWCVQFDLDYLAAACGTAVVEQIRGLARDDVIELHPTGLDATAYRRLFCSLDLIVLPYGERYRNIGSGILLEAIYAGVVPILPRGGHLERLYRDLGGAAPSFAEPSGESLEAAIGEGLEALAELKRGAREVRERWRLHPAAAEQWQTALTAWLRQ